MTIGEKFVAYVCVCVLLHVILHSTHKIKHQEVKKKRCITFLPHALFNLWRSLLLPQLDARLGLKLGGRL